MSRAADGSEQSPFRTAAVRWLAIAWVLFFLVIFFQQTLPNNPEFSRLDLLKNLPFLILDFLDPPQDAAPLIDSGWQYFPQRLPLMLAGLLIFSAGWGLGHVLLRVLRLPDIIRPVSPERFVFATGLGLSVLSLAVLAGGYFGYLGTTLWRAILIL